MTKKDYELIAKAMKQSYSNAQSLTMPKKTKEDMKLLSGIAFTVYSLTAHLENANHKFDRKKFLAACGFVEQEHGLAWLEDVSKEAAEAARAARKASAERTAGGVVGYIFGKDKR